MAPNTKRVFYMNAVSAQVYIDILAGRPDVQLDKLVNESPEAEAERVLSQAHAYQIGSSRQELAMNYQGYTPCSSAAPIWWCCRPMGRVSTPCPWPIPPLPESRW